eukprot:5662367-Pyramimonas_sp.AAC.1
MPPKGALGLRSLSVLRSQSVAGVQFIDATGGCAGGAVAIRRMFAKRGRRAPTRHHREVRR